MIARLFFIAPAIVLALCLTGCATGYSAETVRHIRKVDKELCDIRIALASWSTIAPPGNDEGMDLTNNQQ